MREDSRQPDNDPHRLAKPPTPEEHAANHRALSKMHVGNRFRLMFGLPLLPEPEEGRGQPDPADQSAP